MVKKKSSTLATSAASSGAAAKTSPKPSKRGAPDVPPPAPTPPAPSSSMAGPIPGDWPASTTTKRDEKRARSLGLISSDEGNVILPVDKLFDRFLRIKEADGQTMIGTEVAAVFLKRPVQPIMVRAHPMRLYSGPKDETRINIAELSEKELLDEVRRLTLFSQEDSIPLISSHPPFDADHQPTEIPIAPENLRDLPDDTSEGRDSSAPVGFHTEENASPKDERDDPMNSEADFTNPPPPANDISDTAGNEGFIEPPSKKAKSGAVLPNPAASEASAPAAVPMAQISTASSLSKGKDTPSTAAAATPSSGKPTFASQYTSLEADKAQLQKEVKSSSSKLEGAIKIAAEARQEVDSLKEELEGLKKRLKDEEASRLAAEAWAIEKDDLLRQSSLALLKAADIPVEALDKLPDNSLVNALSMTLASHRLTQELLQKGKGAMTRMHSMIFPKISQDKTLGQLIDAFAVNTKEVIEVFPVPAFVDDSSGAVSESDRLQRMKDRITQMEKDMRSTYALDAIIKKKSELAADVEHYALAELHRATESLNFIALNPAEENKRIHERVNALTQLSSSDEVFWKEHSKASAVAKFQDQVQQVHRFFNKCYKGLRVIWKTMFPLNAVPPTLLTLMSEFSNTKKIRDLVRAQLFAGARFTLALVLVRYPSANLLAIANAVGDLEPLYPKVGLPSNIIVNRLEEASKALHPSV
ncbi:hypothetical protein QYE76_019270 [Lolium multiflorum]|uniref:Uncharacterized protein n=1 Tax=Lolium multiflorum TaxID=4521 RepID=A0AAD8R6P5_LOLMU|nr:hypothetical protein QYE76_019270 [Lolium multiflorum]